MPGYSELAGRENAGSIPESTLFAFRLRSAGVPYSASIVSRTSLTSGSTNGSDEVSELSDEPLSAAEDVSSG